MYTRNSVESKGISRSFFIFGLGVVALSISRCIPILSGSIYLRTVGRVRGREGERKIEYLLARGSNKREKGSSKSGASLTREEEGDAKRRKRERERASMYREAHSLSPVASLFGDFAIAAATRTPT